MKQLEDTERYDLYRNPKEVLDEAFAALARTPPPIGDW